MHVLTAAVQACLPWSVEIAVATQKEWWPQVHIGLRHMGGAPVFSHRFLPCVLPPLVLPPMRLVQERGSVCWGGGPLMEVRGSDGWRRAGGALAICADDVEMRWKPIR